MPAARDTVAIASLLAGATVWGLIWHPYRVLEGMGCFSDALAATLTYFVALLLGRPLLADASPASGRTACCWPSPWRPAAATSATCWPRCTAR
jgi:hypothetical protein